MPGQLIPAGLLVIVPVPDVVTVKAKVVGGGGGVVFVEELPPPHADRTPAAKVHTSTLKCHEAECIDRYSNTEQLRCREAVRALSRFFTRHTGPEHLLALSLKLR